MPLLLVSRRRRATVLPRCTERACGTEQRRVVTRCALRIALLALGVLPVATCTRGGLPTAPREWEILLEVPGARLTAFAAAPDGALFAALGPRILRSLPESSYREWTEVATAPARAVLELYPFSRQSVYAGGGPFAVFMYRQDATGSWSLRDPLIPDSLLPLGTDRGLGKPLVFGLWGRSERDFYAVGTHATILNFDGQQWTRAATPLDVYFHAESLNAYNSWITGVSGGARRTVTAAIIPLEETRAGWVPISLRGGPEGICEPLAVAVTGKDIYFAGMTPPRERPIPTRPCLWRLRNGVWTPMNSTVERFRDVDISGGTQRDGSVLFWSYVGDVIEIRDVGRVTARYYSAAEVKSRTPALVGAATLDSFLYVAGGIGDVTVVARTRR